MNVESYFIKLFSAHTSHIGDDGAVVGKNVYSNDAFCEDVHFRRSWMTLRQIAYKSMLINISDAIAMNAKPQYALLSVAIPSHYSLHDLKELHAGIQEDAQEYEIQSVGASTVSKRQQ